MRVRACVQWQRSRGVIIATNTDDDDSQPLLLPHSVSALYASFAVRSDDPQYTYYTPVAPGTGYMYNVEHKYLPTLLYLPDPPPILDRGRGD